MTTLLMCMLLAQSQAKPTMRAVPRRIVAETLTMSTGVIKPGCSFAEVMAVLGSKAKADKVRKTTGEQLLAAGELGADLEFQRANMRSTLAPRGVPSRRATVSNAGDHLDFTADLAERCGLCDAQVVILKTGSKEEVRVLLMGPVGNGKLTAQMVIYGRERSKPAAWSESGDGFLETVAEDGTRLELRGGRDLFLSAK